MNRRNIIIAVLVAIVLVLLFMNVGKSYFSPAAAPAAAKSGTPSVSDVKLMLNSGTPEINVIVSLIKSGLPGDQAEQLVAQAKKA